MRRSASEIINELESRIARLEKQSKKFPPKAVDLNKITDPDGFWNMTLSDLKAINPVLSTRGLRKENAKMSSIILFLNMAAGAWESSQKRKSKGRKASTRIASDFDPRKAVMYFDIQFEDYNAEEDGVEISSRELSSMESKALKSVSRLLKVRVGNEGHDSFGNLVCNISVNSLEEVAEVVEIVQRNTIGGEDQIDTDVQYFVAQGFTLYPQGVNGVSYQIGGNGVHEDLEEYLEEAGVL